MSSKKLRTDQDFVLDCIRFKNEQKTFRIKSERSVTSSSSKKLKLMGQLPILMQQRRSGDRYKPNRSIVKLKPMQTPRLQLRPIGKGAFLKFLQQKRREAGLALKSQQ